MQKRHALAGAQRSFLTHHCFLTLSLSQLHKHIQLHTFSCTHTHTHTYQKYSEVAQLEETSPRSWCFISGRLFTPVCFTWLASEKYITVTLMHVTIFQTCLSARLTENCTQISVQLPKMLIYLIFIFENNLPLGQECSINIWASFFVSQIMCGWLKQGFSLKLSI